MSEEAPLTSHRVQRSFIIGADSKSLNSIPQKIRETEIMYYICVKNITQAGNEFRWRRNLKAWVTEEAYNIWYRRTS